MNIISSRNIDKHLNNLEKVRITLTKRVTEIYEKMDQLDSKKEILLQVRKSLYDLEAKEQPTRAVLKKRVTSPKDGCFYKVANCLAQQKVSITSAEIAKLTGLTSSEVCAVVGQFRKKGYIHRKGSGIIKFGKNVKLHEITSKGRDYVATIDARK